MDPVCRRIAVIIPVLANTAEAVFAAVAVIIIVMVVVAVIGGIGIERVVGLIRVEVRVIIIPVRVVNEIIVRAERLAQERVAVMGAKGRPYA